MQPPIAEEAVRGRAGVKSALRAPSGGLQPLTPARPGTRSFFYRRMRLIAMSGLGTTLPSAGLIVLRTAIVYVFVLAGFRLLGKRTTGQMTPFDLTLLLLLANSVQNAMVGPDNSLLGGLAAAAVLLLLNATVGRFARKGRAFGKMLRGHARLLVNRGIAVEQNLASEGISRDELMQALREHGVATVEDVRLAVLEVDGTISVLKNDDVSIETHKPHRRFRFRKSS
jgi:uncharacterized membrane protein YcaP (DUF421 family)